jgi:hypothetical protein
MTGLTRQQLKKGICQEFKILAVEIAEVRYRNW